ncbi:MAG: hypothetical protein R3B57_02600 [Phycisphaerales bacterium]
MRCDLVTERLFETLVSGDRTTARRIIEEQNTHGVAPQTLVTDLYWPVHEMIERLRRDDQITTLGYHLATRLLRVLVDQSAIRLLQRVETPPRGRTVFACCGPDEGSELGAQMAVDLLEAHGFRIRFAGGGVPTDEIQALVQNDKPDVLLMFSSAPGDLPVIRGLIDTLHEVGACPNTQIVVGAGVFNRADGLAEEIGADLWASDPLELVQMLLEEPETRATEDQRTVGRKRRLPKAA